MFNRRTLEGAEDKGKSYTTENSFSLSSSFSSQGNVEWEFNKHVILGVRVGPRKSLSEGGNNPRIRKPFRPLASGTLFCG
jgi:hypothetical protein